MGDGPSFDDAENELRYPPTWTTYDAEDSMNGHSGDMADVLTFAPPRGYRDTDADLDGLPDLDDEDEADDWDDEPEPDEEPELPPAAVAPVVEPPAIPEPAVPAQRPAVAKPGKRVQQPTESIVGRYRRRWRRRYKQARQLPDVHHELSEHWEAGARIAAQRWWNFVKDEKGKAKLEEIAAEKGRAEAEDRKPGRLERWGRPPVIVAGTAIGVWHTPGVLGDFAAALPLLPDGPLTTGLATFAACSLLGVPYLGYLGRPDPDQPLLREPDEGRAGKKVPDQLTLTEALADLDIPKLTKAIERGGVNALRWIKIPVEVRDADNVLLGWTCEVELPVVVDKVGAKLKDLAANLGYDETEVFVDRLPGGTAKEARIFVLHRREQGIRYWSPAEGGGNVYRPRRLGRTPRGDEVHYQLWYDEGTQNVLTCGVMGSGKSATNRKICADTAEDPFSEFVIIDAKGSPDFEELEPLCGKGNFLVEGDPAALIYDALNCIDRLRARVSRRNHILRQLNADPTKPSGKKITEKLARLRGFDLHPVLLVVEEVPRLARVVVKELNDNNKTVTRRIGEEFVTALLDLIAIARSAGIAVILSLQKPSAKLFDTDIRSLLQIAAVHACDDDTNRMALGDRLVSAGHTTARFTAADRGKAIIDGLPGGTATVHVDFLPDEPEDGLAEVVARSLEIRRQLGTFGGNAVAADDDDPSVSVAIHAFTRLEADETEGCHSADLVARLAEFDPGRYGGWENGDLTGALNAAARYLGVDLGEAGISRNVRAGKGRVQGRGYRAIDLQALYEAALEHQELRRKGK